MCTFIETLHLRETLAVHSVPKQCRRSLVSSVDSKAAEVDIDHTDKSNASADAIIAVEE